MKKLIKFTPAIFALICSVITLSLYICLYEQHTAMRYVQVCVTPFIPLVIPFLNKFFKLRIPFVFNVAVTIHAIIAINFAAVLGFYDKWLGLDKFIHAYFGFLGGLGVFIFALSFGGRKLKPFGFFLLIFLAVMGLAALWEVWEFSVDCIVATSNCQRWKVEAGSAEAVMTVEEYFKLHNPLADTLWDMIVTIFGCFAFFASVFIDKLCGYKICKSIWRQLNGEDELRAD